MMYYTGIGSRKTPHDVCEGMRRIAEYLDTAGFVLRSGGADGADSAFESGAEHAHIFLPWKGFNGNKSDLYPPTPAAFEMAAKFHPAWDKCTRGARALHARNCYQMLGQCLCEPSKFVVCWHDGSGGTLQAIRIANAHDIQVFNLKYTGTDDVLSYAQSLLNAEKEEV